jgi:hypothetical protein
VLLAAQKMLAALRAVELRAVLLRVHQAFEIPSG